MFIWLIGIPTDTPVYSTEGGLLPAVSVVQGDRESVYLATSQEREIITVTRSANWNVSYNGFLMNYGYIIGIIKLNQTLNSNGHFIGN